MKKFLFTMSYLCLLSALSCTSDKIEADLILTGGVVYTVDSEFSKATVLAVKGDRIVYVGDDFKAVKQTPATQVIDLQGKAVIPGLTDSHLHFLDLGEFLSLPDIYEKPKAEILKIIADVVAKSAPGEWITANGWSHEVWDEPVWPTKEDLDAIAPNNPVCLTRKDGHSVWVNSLALKIAGITAATPQTPGGEIIKNAKGQPSGILTDEAMYPLSSKIPGMTPSKKLECYKLAEKALLGYGITSVMDAGSSVAEIEILKKAYADGQLQIRDYELLSDGEDQKYIAQGGKPFVDSLLSVNCVKLFTDGSLGSRSAWFLEPYNDRADFTGNPRYSDEELYAIVKRVRSEGFQIATHAIGDAAVRQTIDTYEKVLAESPLPDHRWRIEHLQHVAPADFARLGKDSIIASMQSCHASSDLDFCETRLGRERTLGSYAWRTVLDNGALIANGSDAPVEYVNPFNGIYAAVTRKTLQGEPAEGWYPQLRMTREEALKSYTVWGAYAMFAENVKGSLEVGKYADFVVLDRDIMLCPPDEIKDAQALMTVLGGKIVYTK